VWQGVLGHHPCLLKYKFNLISKFYIILYPSVGVLCVSVIRNFDFIMSLIVCGKKEYLKVSVLQQISYILSLLLDLEMLCGVNIMFSGSPQPLPS
jgi:hypothetical protein